MSHKNRVSIVTSSLLALALTGCATDQQGNSFNNQDLNRTRSTVNSAQSAVNTANNASSLTDALVQQLGVSPLQASGGAGALFQVAQARMPDNDFQQLTKSVPEVGSLLKGVSKPKSSGLSQLAAGTSALIGDKNNTLGTVANLAETYQSLGLSSDMVNQFVPVVTDYISKNAAPKLTQALISSLTGL